MILPPAAKHNDEAPATRQDDGAVDNARALRLAAGMLAALKNRFRAFAYRQLEEVPSATLHPVARHVRNLVSMVNEMLPDPIRNPKQSASASAPASVNGVAPAAAPRVVPAIAQAPVFIYFDGRDHRTKAKIEELLHGQKIAFKVLDVTDDEAERSWVTTTAKQTELPIVVIAGTPIGGLGELTQLNLSGDLNRKVFGPQ
jgi:glutaredoxin